MKKITVIAIFLAALLIPPVFAERVAMPPLAMPTAAGNALGGTHVAYTDNVFALLVNPAAIMRVEQRSFFTLAPSLMSPQFLSDIIDPIKSLTNGEDTSALGDMADAFSKQEGKTVLGFELREFPFSIAWVADGFGFGLWNRVFVNANIIGTNIKTDVYSDVMLPVGFAFKILDLERHSIDAGLTLKPFARTIIRETEKITTLVDDSDDFVDTLNIPLIVGGSLDAGLLYRWGGLQAGFTFADILSRGEVVYDINEKQKDNNTYYVPFTMNMGLSYSFRLAFFGVTLAADWRDIRNVFYQDDYLEHRNAALDIGVGLQLSLFDTVYARLGMNEMLPACGLGVNLGPCKIDLAYYGREFGYEPGQLSAAVVELSVAFRPGAKKRDWPWTRRSLMGLFGVGDSK